MNSLGVTFLPGGDQQTGGIVLPNRAQEAIQFLSMRIPKAASAQAFAPQELLPGSQPLRGETDHRLAGAVVRSILAGMGHTLPGTDTTPAPGMPAPPPLASSALGSTSLPTPDAAPMPSPSEAAAQSLAPAAGTPTAPASQPAPPPSASEASPPGVSAATPPPLPPPVAQSTPPPMPASPVMQPRTPFVPPPPEWPWTPSAPTVPAPVFHPGVYAADPAPWPIPEPSDTPEPLTMDFQPAPMPTWTGPTYETLDRQSL